MEAFFFKKRLIKLRVKQKNITREHYGLYIMILQKEGYSYFVFSF